MAGENVVGLTMALEKAKFLADLKGINPEVEGEAKALAAQYAKAWKAIEKSAKDAAKATRDASKPIREAGKSVDDLGVSGGKAFKALGPLGGVVSRLSPQAGAALSSIAGLTSGIEGMAAAGLTLTTSIPILGAITVAVAALALAYESFNHEEEVAAQLEATRQLGREAMLSLDGDLRTAKLDLAVATLELTKQEAQYQKIAFGSQAHIESLLKPLKEQELALKSSRESWSDLGSQLVNTLGSIVPGSVDSYSQSLDENAAALVANQAEQQAVIAKGKELRVTLQAVDLAHGAVSKATKTATKDTKDYAAALSEVTANSDTDVAAAQAEKDADAAQKMHRHIVDLQGANRSAVVDRLDGIDRIDAAEREAVKQNGIQLGRELQDFQGAAEQRAELAQAYADKETEIRRSAADARTKLDKDEAKSAADAAQRTIDQAASLATQALDLVQKAASDAYEQATDTANRLREQLTSGDKYYTDAQKAELKKRIKAQETAAKNSFYAQKAAGMAVVAIDTIMAVSKAAASAPPPYNLLPIGVALATGLAQEAALASQQPSFHKGGPIDMAPDEMGITARRNEFMLNPTGRSTIGDGPAHRANAGVSPSGGEVVSISVYRHTRQVETWKRDGLLAGDPIARAIASGKMVGHRAR